ncbi:MAG: ureidoglycolate lyase [Rhodobacteraceae bacterium]|nr:ureidoglycolate lyase [Paracoccaceae bacterium]
MSRDISIQPITAVAFAPFGDLLDCTGEPDKIINQGLCGRYHDRAQLDFTDGAAGISLFNAEPRSLPLNLEILERHPDGSQAFVPMAQVGFLVVVAPDVDGAPGTPLAFETQPGQAINFHRGVWHFRLAGRGRARGNSVHRQIAATRARLLS